MPPRHLAGSTSCGVVEGSAHWGGQPSPIPVSAHPITAVAAALPLRIFRPRLIRDVVHVVGTPPPCARRARWQSPLGPAAPPRGCLPHRRDIAASRTSIAAGPPAPDIAALPHRTAAAVARPGCRCPPGWPGRPSRLLAAQIVLPFCCITRRRRPGGTAGTTVGECALAGEERLALAQHRATGIGRTCAAAARAEHARRPAADEPIALDHARVARRALAVRPRRPHVAPAAVHDRVAVGLHLKPIGGIAEARHRRPDRRAVLVEDEVVVALVEQDRAARTDRLPGRRSPARSVSVPATVGSWSTGHDDLVGDRDRSARG